MVRYMDNLIAPIAQRTEQTRPKGKMEVQFPLGAHSGCGESVSRYVRDVETLGSIPSTPTHD